MLRKRSKEQENDSNGSEQELEAEIPGSKPTKAELEAQMKQLMTANTTHQNTQNTQNTQNKGNSAREKQLEVIEQGKILLKTMLAKINNEPTVSKSKESSEDDTDILERFEGQHLYKTGRERQIELLPTFKRTASTNLRIEPELEDDIDIDFKDEKYRLKNLSFKQRRRKKTLTKRRRRYMSQEVVKDLALVEDLNLKGTLKGSAGRNKGSTRVFRKKKFSNLTMGENENSAPGNLESYISEKELYFYDYCVDFLSSER